MSYQVETLARAAVALPDSFVGRILVDFVDYLKYKALIKYIKCP